MGGSFGHIFTYRNYFTNSSRTCYLCIALKSDGKVLTVVLFGSKCVTNRTIRQLKKNVKL